MDKIYTNCFCSEYNFALPLAAGAPGSAQLGGKLHLLARHAGADATPVGFGNAPGDGQPDAKAAGGSIAGGVGAVKAVEQLCKRILRNGVAAVAAAQRVQKGFGRHVLRQKDGIFQLI